MKLKLFHLVRLVFIVLAIGGLLFMAGWHMGNSDHKTKLTKALKEGSNYDIALVLLERQRSGADVANDPMFFLSLSGICMRNKDIESALFNLNKAIEILGK
jgi:hypothetical protein